MNEEDKVTLTIDGIEVSVDKGMKIYDAAKAAGVYIPGLCYDPKITRFGGCRLCVVDVTMRGRTRSKWACCEPVADEMSVVTVTDKITKDRQIMMEFLLMDHPLDCPECQASGECGLQDAAYFLDLKQGRSPLKRKDEPLLIDNPVLERNYNRCILCGKCVGACLEVQGNGAIDFQKRGFESEVGTPFRIPLECDFCGQCLAVCPTGSFQDHTEKNLGNAWEYKKTETICPYCAVGCSIQVRSKDNQLAKIDSNDDIGINQGNLCAKGRFGHDMIYSSDRATSCKIKGATSSFESTIDIAATWIKELIAKHGADSIGLLAGEYLTNEDLYLMNRFSRAGLDSGAIYTISNILNSKLESELFDQFGDQSGIISYDNIKRSDLFLFFGSDPEKENPVVANMVRMAMRDNPASLLIAGSRNILFNPAESERVTYQYGSEKRLLVELINHLTEATGEYSSIKLKASSDKSQYDSNIAKKMAKLLKAASLPVIIVGNEISSHPDSVEIMKLLTIFANLTDAKLIRYKERCNSQGANDLGLSGSYLPGYEKSDDSEAVAKYSKVWGNKFSPKAHKVTDLFKAIEAGYIKGLILVDDDPSLTYPNYKLAKEMLSGLELLIVVSPFELDIPSKRTLFIPSLTAFEKDGTFTNNEGRVQQVTAAIKNENSEIKSEWEIFSKLGTHFSLDERYVESLDITKEISENVAGYENLYSDIENYRSTLVTYPKSREDRLANFRLTDSTISLNGSLEYKYLALTGNSLFHLGKLTRASKVLNDIEPCNYIEISYEDAINESLNQDDKVEVESEYSKIVANVRIDDRSTPGIVFIPKNFEDQPSSKLSGGPNMTTKVKLTKIIE
ncbi:MAG: molybdopterin-dependent oxidoreductase [Nitrospinota bacterium]